MGKEENNPTVVQDHFWSFIHGAQLIWYYFGTYCSNKGLSKGEARGIVNSWKDRLEDRSEADAWDIINSLRNEDVHVSPVRTKNTQEPKLVYHEGEVATHNGENVVHGDWKFIANHNGKNRDVWELCEKGIGVYEQFIAEYDKLC